MITIRKTEKNDLDTVIEIYAIAKKFMDASGNPTQWEVGYPTRSMIEADIERGESYVILEDGVIHGVFMFMQREDPAYSYIEDGAWQNDLPYGTIHRVASDGHIKRMLDRCVEFCRTFTENLRIDTCLFEHFGIKCRNRIVNESDKSCEGSKHDYNAENAADNAY